MSRKLTSFYFLAFFFSLCTLIYLGYSLNTHSTNQIQSIESKNEIRISILNSPENHFTNASGDLGFEYELATAFAQTLGVDTKFTYRDSASQLLTDIVSRDSHISIPGYKTPTNKLDNIRKSDSYLSHKSVVVYRVTQGIKYPRAIENILDRKIIVSKDSIQLQQLQDTQKHYPHLTWAALENETIYEILEQVITKQSDIAIVSHLDFKKLSPFFPGLKVAFELPSAYNISWLLADKKDISLSDKVNQFLTEPTTQALIDDLEKKYYSTSNPLNFNDTLSFKKHYETRFPQLEAWFKEAGAQTGTNWLLLAAIAYQESHWNPKAVSPTGVKGIMMLTKAAAKEVNVKDRTDPKQSIFGGAQYLINVKKKIPKRIIDPDRTFLALAGYNTGFGHLEDARILTTRAGLNPDSWEDVSKHLPLLTKAKYYKTVKHGYARGHEPVTYVKNIREYLKVLRWEIQQSEQIANKEKKKQTEPSNDIPTNNTETPSTL